jgi:multicomponent Na+:H+ antiporter subunit B
MRSLILSTTTRLLIPLMLIFSIFLLLRGHNAPGGGFIGGLVAASAYALYSISFGVDETKKLLNIDPLSLIKVGLAVSMISSLIPVIFGDTYFKGLWLENEIPVIGKLGTPLIFDIGVYLVVIGIVTKIIIPLFEEDA